MTTYYSADTCLSPAELSDNRSVWQASSKKGSCSIGSGFGHFISTSDNYCRDSAFLRPHLRRSCHIITLYLDEYRRFTARYFFILDPLSLVFCFVITFVGALIHLYSVEFMKDDDGFTLFCLYEPLCRFNADPCPGR